MWHKIHIQSNQIERDTGRAILIKFPSKSEFKGKFFWHPSKLVRGRNYAYTFSFTEEFTFKVITKKGEHVDTIGFEEMLEAFEVTNEAIENAIAANEKKNNEHYLEIIEPQKIKVTDVEVDVSLLR